MAYLLSLELVQPLKSFGFTVQHATTRESPANRTLAIENLFVEIVWGNELRRPVIRFGLSRTEVRTQAQTSLGTPSGQLLVDDLITGARSPKKPRMGPMVGVGGPVTSEVSAATGMNQTVEGNARRTVDEIAKTLSSLLVRLGWIPKEYLAP